MQTSPPRTNADRTEATQATLIAAARRLFVDKGIDTSNVFVFCNSF